MEKLAPIALFTYKRLAETKSTIESLAKNHGAEESELYIFSDGPKTDKDLDDVMNVRKYIREIKGFKKITIIESEKNKGLANSIISGVTKLLDENRQVIVLEDDLITSKYFIRYMNEALKVYEYRQDIWSISGYTPDIKFPESYEENTYLTMRGCSWGWATWQDRWVNVDWKVKDYQEFKKNKEKIKRLNSIGNNMSRILELQMLGKIDSWGVRWVYNQVKLGKYTVYPRNSLVKNIGFSKGATHGTNNPQKYDVKLWDKRISLNESIEDDLMLKNIFKEYYDLSIIERIAYFIHIKSDFLYKLLKRLKG